MLPILAKDFSGLMSALGTSFNNKRVIKRFNKTYSKLNLDFHMSMAVVIALSLHHSCKSKLTSQSRIKVLVHQLNNHDCIDHLRWVALVPAILGHSKLQLDVVGISSKPIVDNVSNSRALIDYIIDKEDLHSSFTSTLIEGDIDELCDLDTFDLIINNNGSPVDLFKLSESKTMVTLLKQKIPYVITDFTQANLLNNYNLFRNSGYASDTRIITNPFSTMFSSKVSSTKYGHANYLLEINKHVSYRGDLPQKIFASYLSALKARLDHGDLLSVKHIAKKLNENEIQLFSDVILDTKSGTIRLNHFGDIFRLSVSEDLGNVTLENKTLDDSADNFLWAINLYSKLLLEITSKKEHSA